MALRAQKPQALAGPGASAGDMQPREKKFSLPSRECTFLASGSFGKSGEKAWSTQVGPHTFKTSAVPFPTCPESSPKPEHFTMMTRSKTTLPVPDFPIVN